MPAILSVDFYDPASESVLADDATVVTGTPITIRIVFDFLPTSTLTIEIYEDDVVNDDLITTFVLESGDYNVVAGDDGWVVEFTGWVPDLAGGDTPEYYANVTYDELTARTQILNVEDTPPAEIIEVAWLTEGPIGIGEDVQIAVQFDKQPVSDITLKIYEQDTLNDDLVFEVVVPASGAVQNDDDTWTLIYTWESDYLGESGGDDARYEVEASYGDQEVTEKDDLVVLSPRIDLVDAFWQEPDEDHEHGSEVVMIARFEAKPESDITFIVSENDLIGDDRVDSFVISPDEAYLADDGYWYVEATWIAHYAGDIIGSAEYVFDVRYENQKAGENDDIKVIGDPVYTAPVEAFELALLANHVYEDAFRIADIPLDDLASAVGADETVSGWSKVLDDALLTAFNSVHGTNMTNIPLADGWDLTGFDAAIYEHPDQDVIVLSIAGTDFSEHEDLLTDLSIVLADVQDLFSSVPAQTLNAYLYARVAAAYAESLGKELVLTGHSLGGALASLLSAQGFGEAVVFNAADAVPWIEELIDGHTYDLTGDGGIFDLLGGVDDLASSVGLTDEEFNAAFNVTLIPGPEHAVTVGAIEDFSWGLSSQKVYGFVIDNELLSFLGYDYSFGQPPHVIELNNAAGVLDLVGKLDNHKMDIMILALAGEDDEGKSILSELSRDLPWIVNTFLGVVDIAGDVLGVANDVAEATVIGELIRDALIHPEKLILNTLLDELQDLALQVAQDQLDDEDVKALAESLLIDAWKEVTGDEEVPSYITNALTAIGDVFDGDVGDDLIAGFGGDDNLFGGAGNDVIYGGEGNDILKGGSGNDIVGGDEGNDTLWAGQGDDGNDIYIGGNGDDVLAGGPGDDLLIGDGATAGLDGNSNANDDGADKLYGGSGADTLVGGGWHDVNEDNVFEDGEQNYAAVAGDQVWGGAGDDVLYGSGGADIIGGGTESDLIKAGGGSDTIFGGKGDGEDTIYGGQGADTVYSSAGDDFVSGGNGHDLIFTGAGQDTVSAGGGNDVVWAGGGDDVFTLGAGQDIFAMTNTSGADTVTDFNIVEDTLDLSEITVFGEGETIADYAVNTVQNDKSGLLIDFGTASVFMIGLSIDDLNAMNVTYAA